MFYLHFFVVLQEPDFTEERIVVQENENQKKSDWFSRKPTNITPQKHVSRPPSTSTFSSVKNPHLPMNGSPRKGPPTVPPVDEEDELPPRMDSAHASPRVAPVPLFLGRARIHQRHHDRRRLPMILPRIYLFMLALI